MKAFGGSIVLLFAFFCEFAHAQQPRTSNLSPNLLGSVSPGVPTGGTIQLTIADAIDRALKYNIGGIIGEQETRVARAERVRALSELMPKVNTEVTETIQQISLSAFGFSGFPGVRPIIGPFSVFDARARYSQVAMNFRYLHELRAASERVTASNYALQDVRELIVLITTDLYLEAVAGNSRVEAARAQLRTAQAVYDRARDLKDSGVVAGIDVLRAQVQMQAQQQRVVATENDLAKQKLNIARAIGHPQGQDFVQTDALVTAAVAIPTLEQALDLALGSRADYRRASSLIHAAEESRKAAVGRRMPSFEVNANYGDIGRAPGNSHGTMFVQGTLSVPIYTGERARAEILESDALLEQRKAEASNLRDRIEYEVRTAKLDIPPPPQQVPVARAARDGAPPELTPAQDPFLAGVAHGAEVTPAPGTGLTREEKHTFSPCGLKFVRHGS